MERETKQMNAYNKKLWAAHSGFNQIKSAVFSGRTTFVDLKPYKLGLFRYLVGTIIFWGMFQVPAWSDPMGLEYYGYTPQYEKKDVDPNGIYKEFGGIVFTPTTGRLLLVDDTEDAI
ncbi:MAG: hypothetical protein GF384_07060, partial [Elusimicrobia bacterium]|nr:hypothetical protein [Elusimicrobiota bacterium]